MDTPTLARVVGNIELTPRNREMCNDYTRTAQKIEWTTGMMYTVAMKLCICKKCGKEYMVFPSQRGDKYCSQKCYQSCRVSPKETACQTCSRVFTPTDRQKSNRFCSPICYWKSMKIPPEEKSKRANERTRRYRRSNPEWCQSVKAKRRAIEAGASGHFTAEDWLRIKNLQNNKCKLCGEGKKLTVDHIKPLSRGGSNHPENIQGLCGICNSRKWAKI